MFIQLYIEKNQLESTQPGGFSWLKKLIDVGDIVGVSGGIKKTERGELSVVANSMLMLSKSLRPLPDKWHGLTDVETRYRQRYVDLIINPAVRETFRIRARALSHIRRFLEDRSFLEVRCNPADDKHNSGVHLLWHSVGGFTTLISGSSDCIRGLD